MENQNNSELKNDKPNTGSTANYKIVLFCTIIVLLVSIAALAWARLTVNQENNTTGQVARWYFKVIGDGIQNEDEIGFAITRTDQNRYG